MNIFSCSGSLFVRKPTLYILNYRKKKKKTSRMRGWGRWLYKRLTMRNVETKTEEETKW